MSTDPFRTRLRGRRHPSTPQFMVSPIGVLVYARCRLLHTNTPIAAATDRCERPASIDSAGYLFCMTEGV
jgi:hypothetical protein